MTPGADSLTHTFTAGHTVTAETVTGDWALTLNGITAGADVITSLVDGGSTNTLTTLTIAGTQAFTVPAITDTVLSAVNITDIGTVILGAAGTPVSANGVTVTLSGTGTSETLFLSGNTDIVKANTANTATVTDTGNTLTFTEINTVVDHVDTIVASGTSNVITLSTLNKSVNLITVGANSSITLGTATSNDNAGSHITITGDTVGSSLSATPNLTTITNAGDTHTQIIFGGSAGATGTAAAINVGSTSTLAGALDFAASHEVGAAANTATADWFQFNGNTYVVEHTGAAETALGATDYVVKIAGLLNITTGGLLTSATTLTL